MRKSFFFAGLAAIAAISFSSCSKNEVETPDSPKTFTHTVTIKAGAPETRTEIVMGETSATFKWSADDASRFVIKENNTAGTGISLTSTDDYVTATLGATFATEAADSYEYTAWMSGTKTNSGNPRLSTSQKPSATSFDPEADILIAKPQTFDAVQNTLTMQFYRPVAISKMTLKGLSVGSTVSTVSITGDKNIAGYYNPSSNSWTGDNKTINLTLKNQTVPPSGNVDVFFLTIPVEDVTLTVQVTASNAIYTKTFSKTISFSESQVTVFGVNNLASTPSATFEYNNGEWLESKDIVLPETSKGTELGKIAIDEGPVSMRFEVDGKTKSRIWNSSGNYDLRVYDGAAFSIMSTDGYVIESVAFTANTPSHIYLKDGEISSGKWSGSSQLISFSNESSTQISAVTVTYRDANANDHLLSVNDIDQEVAYNETTATIEYKALNISDLVVSSTSDAVTVNTNDGNAVVTFSANALTEVQIIPITFTSASAGVNKIVNIIQAAAPAATSISSLEKDGTYTVSGQVAGLSTKGFILADNTGAIFVYTNTDVTSLYTIGQTVSVSGTVSSYGKALQFPVESSIIAGSSGEYEYGTPATYTENEIETFLGNTADRLATYVSVSGILEKSGSFYNVKVGSTTSNVTLYAVPTSMMANVSEGDNVTIKGYAMNVSSGKCGILVTEITSNPSPVLLFEDITSVSADGVTDATITGTAANVDGWTPSVAESGCVSAASISDNFTTITYTVPANTEATEKTGTITVTLTKDGESDVVFTINVTQNAYSSEVIQNVTLAYSGSSTTNMTGNNDASTLGLGSDWSVVGSKGSASNFPGLNKDGTIRLYYHVDGSNSITISSPAKTIIKTVTITYNGSNNNGKVLVGESEITGANGSYTINDDSFVITNGNTSNIQVHIKSIVINYTASN